MNCLSNIYEDCTAWTGLNDLDIDGTYVWDHSNAPLTFSNWNDGEPSVRDPDHAQTRDCTDILRGGTWNDRFCSYSNGPSPKNILHFDIPITAEIIFHDQ